MHFTASFFSRPTHARAIYSDDSRVGRVCVSRFVSTFKCIAHPCVFIKAVSHVQIHMLIYIARDTNYPIVSLLPLALPSDDKNTWLLTPLWTHRDFEHIVSHSISIENLLHDTSIPRGGSRTRSPIDFDSNLDVLMTERLLFLLSSLRALRDMMIVVKTPGCTRK